MANAPRILALAGSTREGSFNKKLVKIASDGARAAGASVTEIDLRDFSLPFFDEDLEKRDGLPANGRKLKDLFEAHDGLLISSPEYNSSYSAVLKNTIDWVSRPEPGKASLSCFAGKIAAIMSASPGNLGGLRGLVTLRMLLCNIMVHVIPEQVAVSKAHEAIGPDGKLVDAKQQQSVEKLGAGVAGMIARMRG